MFGEWLFACFKSVIVYAILFYLIAGASSTVALFNTI